MRSVKKNSLKPEHHLSGRAWSSASLLRLVDTGYLVLKSPGQVEVCPKTQCQQHEHSISAFPTSKDLHSSNTIPTHHLRLFSSFCLDSPFQQLLFLLRTAFKVNERKAAPAVVIWIEGPWWRLWPSHLLLQCFAVWFQTHDASLQTLYGRLHLILSLGTRPTLLNSNRNSWHFSVQLSLAYHNRSVGKTKMSLPGPLKMFELDTGSRGSLVRNYLWKHLSGTSLYLWLSKFSHAVMKWQNSFHDTREASGSHSRASTPNTILAHLGIKTWKAKKMEKNKWEVKVLKFSDHEVCLHLWLWGRCWLHLKVSHRHGCQDPVG